MFKNLKTKLAEETKKIQTVVSSQVAEGLQQWSGSQRGSVAGSDVGSLNDFASPSGPSEFEAEQFNESSHAGNFGLTVSVDHGTTDTAAMDSGPVVESLIDVDLSTPTHGAKTGFGSVDGPSTSSDFGYNAMGDTGNLRPASAASSGAARLRRDSEDSFGSIDSLVNANNFLPSIPESGIPAVRLRTFPSDAESMTDGDSVAGSSMSAAVTGASREQISSVLHKLQGRAANYKDKYRAVAKEYNAIVKENDKIRNILTATQDKALNRVQELREENKLERKSKRHLEQELRLKLDEKDQALQALKMQVTLFKEGKVPDEAMVATAGSTETNTAEFIAHREKIKRLEDLLTRCKETIRTNKAKLGEVVEENKQLQSKLAVASSDQGNAGISDLVAQRVVAQWKEKFETAEHSWKQRMKEAEAEWALKISDAEERSTVTIAEAKQGVHEQIEEKDVELMNMKHKLNESKEKYDAEIVQLRAELEEARSGTTEAELESKELVEKMSKTKVEVVDAVRAEEEKKREKQQEMFDKKIEDLLSKHQDNLKTQSENFDRQLSEKGIEFEQKLREQSEQHQLAIEERELQKMASLSQQDMKLDEYQAEIESLKTDKMQMETTIQKLKDDVARKTAEAVQLEEDFMATCRKHQTDIANLRSELEQQSNYEQLTSVQNVGTSEAMTSELAALKSAAEDHKREMSVLQEQLEEGNNKIKMLEEAKALWDSERMELENKLEDITRDLDREREISAEKSSELGTKLEENKSLLAEKTSALEAVRAELSEMQETLDITRNQVFTLETNDANSRKTLEAKEALAFDLQQKLNEAMDETETLGRKLAEAESLLAEREDLLNAKEAKLAEVGEALSKIRVITTLTQSQLEEKNAKVDELLAKLETQELEFKSRLDSLMETKNVETSDFEHQLEAIKNSEVAKVEREFSDKLAELQSKWDVDRMELNGQAETLRQQVEVATSDSENSKSFSDSLKEQLSLMESDNKSHLELITMLQDKLSAKEGEYSDLFDKFSELNSNISSKNDKISELTKTMEDLEIDLMHLRESIDQKDLELNGAKMEIDELKSTQSRLEQLKADYSDFDGLEWDSFIRNKLSVVEQLEMDNKNMFVELESRKTDFANMEAKLQEMEGTDSQLKLELAKFHEGKHDSQVEMSQKLNELVDIENKLLAKDDQILEQITRISELQSGLEERDSKLVESRDLLEETSVKLHDYTELNDKLNSKVSELTEELTEKNSELSSANEQLNLVQSELAEVKSKLELTLDNAANSSEQIQLVLDEKAKAEREMIEMQLNFDSLATQLSAKTSEIAERDSKISTLDEERVQLSTSLHSINSEITNSRSEIDQLKTELAVVQTKLSETENLASERENKIAEIQYSISEKEKLASENLQKSEAGLTELASVRDQLEARNEKLVEMTNFIQSLKTEHEILLEEKNNKMDELTNQINGLQSVINKKDHELAFAQANCDESESVISELQSKISGLGNSLESFNRENECKIAELDTELESKRLELKNAQSKLQEYDIKSSALISERDSSLEEVQTLRESLESANLSLKEAEHKFEEEKLKLAEDSNQKLGDLKKKAEEKMKQIKKTIEAERQSSEDSLNTELDRLRVELQEVTGSRDEVVARLTDMTSSLGDKEADLTILSSELESVKQNIASLQSSSVESESLQMKVTELEEICVSKDAEIRKLSDKLKQARKDAKSAGAGHDSSDSGAGNDPKAIANALEKAEKQFNERLAHCKHEHEENVKQMTDRFEKMMNERQVQWEFEMASLRDECDSAKSKFEMDYNENMSHLQNNLSTSDERFEFIKQDYDERIKTNEVELAALRAEHAESLAAVEEQYKASMKRRLEEMDAAHKEEIEGLSKEWDQERRGLEKQAQETQGDRPTENTQYLRERVRQLEADVASMKDAHRNEIDRLIQGAMLDPNSPAAVIAPTSEDSSHSTASSNGGPTPSDPPQSSFVPVSATSLPVSTASTNHGPSAPIFSESSTFLSRLHSQLHSVSLGSFPSSPLFNEPTEAEYLRNILFLYMTERENLGKEAVTLARVISAVLKFSGEQSSRIVQKEEARQSSWYGS